MLPLPVAAFLAALAAGAAFMAAPEFGAAQWNADMRAGCAQMRAIRPTAECPPPKNEAWATEWLLIAAALLVGAAIIATRGRGRHD